MSNEKRFVVKHGLQSQNMEFVSPDKTKRISVSLLDSDTLSFSGDSGQLFSITDSMSGTIFAVNDISGVPSIEVDDTGTIRFAETFGNVLIGTATDDGSNKLQVNGSITGTILKSTVAVGTAPLTVTSTTRVSNLNVATAGTADVLTTERTINGVSFNGSANITITAANPNALTIGTGLSGTSYTGSAAVTIALASGYGDTLNPYASKTANFFLAAPNGVAGVPTFRAIVAADIPTLNQNTTGTAANVTGTVAVANGGTGVTTSTGTGSVVLSASPTFTGTISAANLTLSGDLIVNGTTTTINSTTLTVDDKNIELGSVASPTNTTADGGGITLKGATDKTFNWVNATSAWTSSENIALAAGKDIILNGLTSGSVTLIVPDVSGTNTITIPAITGTVVTTGDTGTVTNTMLAGSIANAKLTNSSVTVGTTAIALGASSTTLAGLTSVTSTTFIGAAGTAALPAFSTSGDTNTGIFFPAADTIAFSEGGTESMRIDSTGNVGINNSAPQTRLTVGSGVVDAAGHTYDTNSLYVVHQTPTSTTVLNDPKEVLLLGRQGTGGQAYGAAAAFRLSRYENNSVNSRTRLDLTLAHDAFLTSAPTVLTALSNGNVGIGTTNIGSRLSIRGTSATGYNNTFSQTGSTAQIISDEMSVDQWYPTFNIATVRQSLTTGSGAFGGIGFSTIDDSNNSGQYDAARIAVINNGGNTILSGTALAFYTQVGGISNTNPATEHVRITSAGNVGIGTTAPSAKLHVVGNIALTGDIVDADENEIINFQTNDLFVRGKHITADFGVWARGTRGIAGFDAASTELQLFANSAERMRIDASGNVGIGISPPTGSAGRALYISGQQGGYAALSLGASGGEYGRVGYGFAITSTSGAYNYSIADFSSAVGFASGGMQFYTAPSGTAGAAITFTQRMTLDSSGRLLIGTTAASGANLLQVNSDTLVNGLTIGRGLAAVSTNTAVGVTALAANTTGNSNVAVGHEALFSNTTGVANTATGLSALRANTGGTANTATGRNALLANTTGLGNTAIGLGALVANTTGSYNTCIGHDSGQALTTGSNNTIIGRIAGTAGLADTVIIGAGTTERLRIDSTGNMGIGTSTPGYKLEVNGSFAATTKSFVIDHPTEEGMKLRYGSLESPYHGVRLTGEAEVINGVCVVELPDYIRGLCKQEGSQVQITNIRHGKVLWVDSIDVDNNEFTIATEETGNYKFYWSFTAIRKDVEDMIVEFEE